MADSRESASGCTLCAGVHIDTLAEYGGCQGCGRGAASVPPPDPPKSPLAEAIEKARRPDPVAFIEAYNRWRAGR